MFLDRQGQSRQGDKRIARPTLKPGITSQDVPFVFRRTIVELMGSVDQTMKEIVARTTRLYFFAEELLQLFRIAGRGRCREHDPLSFLDVQLEISGHIEIFIGRIATLTFFRILHPAIPIGLEHKLIVFRELHVQLRITWVHTCLDALVHLRKVSAGRRIFVRELSNATECQERFETQSGFRVCIQQRIAYQDSVFVVLENHLFLQQHSTYSIDSRRNFVTIELANILVSIGTEMIALIFVQTQVERCTMLDDRNIQRRQ